jgi:hypothetical protein
MLEHGRSKAKSGETAQRHAACCEDKLPKKFQLELIGTQSEDRLDKKICPWDAVKMYAFKEGAETSKRFYEP